MKDFIDRLSTKPNRYKLTEEGTGKVSYAKVERADVPTREGTPLNRAAFLALQGMEGSTTVFNANGSIGETSTTGKTVTEFLADGSIRETFTGVSGMVVRKTTSFQADGSIREVIS